MTDAAQGRLSALLATAQQHQTPGLHWQQWRETGVGPRLLLLHGGFGSWSHWYANIEALREQRELWTVDLPGLGESADIDPTAQPQDFAARLLEGIDHLWSDDTPIELAGFSFGAMVGARLAERLGDRCRRFVAIGAAGWGGLHVQVALTPPPRPGTDWASAAPVHESNLRALMFSNHFPIDELAVYLHAENLARARFNSRALSRTDDFVQALAAIQAPCLCAWGSSDATAGDAQALAAREARLVELGKAFELLPDVGHWAMYEAPAEVNRLILAG